VVFRVVNQTREKVLADSAVKAVSLLDRFKGLMMRKHFSLGDGLHLSPCRSIHTFFMRIPIDALFLDTSGQVVKAISSLRPWRATGMYSNARSVLELPSGTIVGTGTTEGDVLVFEPKADVEFSSIA
jgi:uncharacterized membrane protein (UPF0127 family)